MDELTYDDGFRDEEPASSKLVLDAIARAETEFRPYFDECDRVDKALGALGGLAEMPGSGYDDPEFDVFWASMEVLKPATYAKPPQPVVTPRFQDRDKVKTLASELVERCLSSILSRDDFDQVMIDERDDLIASARSVVRVAYEDKGEGKRVQVYHVDRLDFLHEPARKWSEVGWVAFAAYLTEREFRDRFPGKPLGGFEESHDRRTSRTEGFSKKCKIWEVWHRADNRVYWVTEGVDELLDESKPFLKLDGFYPCPRPAYGSVRRRSLIPIPDYVRYRRQLDQIEDITRRVHLLLDWIKVKGFIPGGGDVGSAVETALKQSGGDDVLLIPVPGAALTTGSGKFIEFLPLDQFAAAIQGLIESRREIINNFYELSGISDIMRGETEAQETLGAQRLKSQYGSVRVREKVNELQRLCRDVARIAGEIVAEKFGDKDILDMAQMEIPKLADLKASKDALKQKMQGEIDGAMQTPSQDGRPPDRKAAASQVVEANKAELEALSKAVPLEDVMKLLRDERMRGLTIEIETDSTVMVDEMQEKEQRGEFLNAFSSSVTALQPLLALGEAGAELAGGIMKFSLAPYRAGRELDGLIDDFIKSAPDAMAAMQGGDAEKSIAEANQKLAEAELQKAQAAIAKVQADTAKSTQEIQLKAAEAAEGVKSDRARIEREQADTRGKLAETEARIEKIHAEIQKMGLDAGVQQRRETREDAKFSEDVRNREVDRTITMERSARDDEFRERDDQFRREESERNFNTKVKPDAS